MRHRPSPLRPIHQPCDGRHSLVAAHMFCYTGPHARCLRKGIAMHLTSRLLPNCPVCENRGMICVSDDDQNFPCPSCNRRCAICLEQPADSRRPRVIAGSLFAAVRPTPMGLDLFEGYLCDWHKTFRSAIGISPPMVGCLRPGDAFIIVQRLFETHAVT